MRLRAVTRIGLKRANSLSHDIPSVLRRTVNVSEGLQGVSIFLDCVRVGVLLAAGSGRSDSMRVWSLAKVFHTCGKNCGKSPDLAIGCRSGPIFRRFREGEARKRRQNGAWRTSFAC